MRQGALTVQDLGRARHVRSRAERARSPIETNAGAGQARARAAAPKRDIVSKDCALSIGAMQTTETRGPGCACPAQRKQRTGAPSAAAGRIGAYAAGIGCGLMAALIALVAIVGAAAMSAKQSPSPARATAAQR